MYWVEHLNLKPTSGGGLGKVTFTHVHEDGTEHECTIVTLRPDSAWCGTAGEYNPDIAVTCKACKMELERFHDIRFRA